MTNVLENAFGAGPAAPTRAMDIWSSDVAGWRKEIDQMLSSIRELEGKALEHRRGLQDHLDSLTAARTGEGVAKDGAPTRDDYETLKERHRVMMSNLKAISSTLEAMGSKP